MALVVAAEDAEPPERCDLTPLSSNSWNHSQSISSMENLKTLLVANRGEIATRILKTAKYVLASYLDIHSDRNSPGDYTFEQLQSTQRQMQHHLM